MRSIKLRGPTRNRVRATSRRVYIRITTSFYIWLQVFFSNPSLSPSRLCVIDVIDVKIQCSHLRSEYRSLSVRLAPQICVTGRSPLGFPYAKYRCIGHATYSRTRLHTSLSYRHRFSPFHAALTAPSRPDPTLNIPPA